MTNETDKANEATSESKIITLSEHLSNLEIMKSEIIEVQSFEQHLEKLKNISENTTEDQLIENLQNANLPTSVSLPDLVIQEMQRHDIPNKMRVINRLFSELVASFTSMEEDPEDRSISETSHRALGIALQRYAGDHAMQALRGRDTAMSLVRQLSKAVNILTSVGQAFDLEVDGEKVEATIDFSKWPHDKMTRLAVHITTYSEKLIRQHEMDEARVQSMSSTVNEMKSKEIKIEEKIKDDRSIIETKISSLESAVKRLNEILADYKDQNCWVVAKVDNITRLPIRFYYEDEETQNIRSCKTFERAIVKTQKKAKEIRWHVAQHLQDNAKRNEYRTIGDNVVVMRITLAVVDYTADYEE